MKQGRPESSVVLNIRITPTANEMLHELAGLQKNWLKRQKGLSRGLCELIMRAHARRVAIAERGESGQLQKKRDA